MKADEIEQLSAHEELHRGDCPIPGKYFAIDDCLFSDRSNYVKRRALPQVHKLSTEVDYHFMEAVWDTRLVRPRPLVARCSLRSNYHSYFVVVMSRLPVAIAVLYDGGSHGSTFNSGGCSGLWNGMNANYITDRADLLLRSKHEATQALERAINDIAPTNIPILLMGESGTGKKIIAHYVHMKSTRMNEPFARIICAVARPEALEVYFRHKHEQANHSQPAGSLFLEEISELDGSNQRHLLYMLPDLEDHSIETSVTPRLLSSTSRNLDQQVRSGSFRQELYYRINGACLRLPPLRERSDDIPDFVELFLVKHSAALCKPRPVLTSFQIQRLQEYPWPGNMRELENTVKRIIALGNPDIEIANLGAHSSPVQQSNPTEKKLASLKIVARAASHQAERQLILQALEKTKWNRKRAAQELQISYKSLLYKLKQIGAEEPELT